MYAALAARAGYRVAVLGQGTRRNAYRHLGHVMLAAPERFYGFRASPAVDRVFGELSLAMEMRTRPQPVDPMFQVVLPGARLDVVADQTRFRRSLARELPAASRTFEAFETWAEQRASETDALVADLDVLPPSGLRASARYRRLVATQPDALATGLPAPLVGTPGNALVHAVVQGTLTHLTTVAPAGLPPIAMARIWTHLRQGICRVPGGLDGLTDLFLRKLREQCGAWLPDAAVEEIRLRRGRAHEVVLDTRGETLGCDLLVGNMAPHRFAQLIAPDARRARYQTDLAARMPAAWRFVLNVAVDPRVIPEGMGPEVLLIGDPAQPLLGDNCLWISRPGVGPHAGGEGRPGPGVLTVTALLRAHGIAPVPAEAERLTAGILGRLRALMPWLEEHLLAYDAPSVVDGRPDATRLEPVMSDVVPMTLGLSAASAQTPYRNILLGGTALFGGLGFEGTCLGALQDLELTRRLVRLKAPTRIPRISERGSGLGPP